MAYQKQTHLLERSNSTQIMLHLQQSEPISGIARRTTARFGYGDLFKAIRNRPLVSERKRDIFGIGINRKEDILIQDVNAGKMR